jgi:hypothetical protein
MLSLLDVLLTTFAVALGISAPSAADPDEMADTIKCVSLVGETLDLTIEQDAADIRSDDAGVSIRSTDGEVTLLVAVGTSSGKTPVSVTFKPGVDTLTFSDTRDNVLQLRSEGPDKPVQASFSFTSGALVTITARSAALDKLRPPTTSKAVLKPVTTCPR